MKNSEIVELKQIYIQCYNKKSNLMTQSIYEWSTHKKEDGENGET